MGARLDINHHVLAMAVAMRMTASEQLQADVLGSLAWPHLYSVYSSKSTQNKYLAAELTP